MSEPVGLTTLIRRTGLTARQIDYWVRTKRIVPSICQSTGSGSHAKWSEDDVARLTRARERLDWGMTLDAALRHEDPPLPPPL